MKLLGLKRATNTLLLGLKQCCLTKKCTHSHYTRKPLTRRGAAARVIVVPRV